MNDEFINPIKYCFGEQLKENKKLDKKTLESLSGKTFYGEYKEGDRILYFMLQKIKKENGSLFDKTINLSLHPIVERDLKRLDKEYKFIRMSSGNLSNIPLFEKKK